MGHIRHDLRRCFELHVNYLEHGTMLPDVKSDQFGPLTVAEWSADHEGRS